MLTAKLDDGTTVRVMKSPYPVNPLKLAHRKPGDLIVGHGSMPAYFPRKQLKKKERLYIVRRGEDGNLWLVHVRKDRRC